MTHEPHERRDAPARRNRLPGELGAGLECLSGHDVSGATVHGNSGLPAALDAHAYTQGQHIHLAPGQDHRLLQRPATEDEEKLEQT